MNSSDNLLKQTLLIVASFLMVAFGEPTSSTFLARCAALAGFVPLFLALLDRSTKKRFWIGALFFTGVQLVQLFWLTSHPYSYIYAVWVLLSLLMGLQFGCLMLFLTREHLFTWRGLFLLPALWTLFEWSRLFLLTGFTFNPIGMAMANLGEFAPMASFIGVYGLSFLVMAINTLFTRLLLAPKNATVALVTVAFLLIPGLAGSLQKRIFEKEAPAFHALIVETRLMPEELENKDFIQQALTSWQNIILALQPHLGTSFDLIMFPEIVVPFAGEAPLFHLTQAEALFLPLGHTVQLEVSGYTKENYPLVSSWSIAAELSRLFNSPLLIGLEGADFRQPRERNRYYNSGYFIRPKAFTKERYDKQALLPMAEEIPASWLKPLAAHYGLFDSFQAGTGPVLFQSGPHSIATSICYEDTFASIMRQQAKEGATILTNLTNDAWYPNSNLGAMHFELARLRAIENGKPLLRACNFGTSGAIDAFGKVVAKSSFEEMKQPVQAFRATVSTNQFTTWYTRLGNMPLLLLCLLLLIAGCWNSRK